MTDQLKLATVENHSPHSDHLDELSARRAAVRARRMADTTQALCAHPRLKLNKETQGADCPDCCLSLTGADLWRLVDRERP